MEVLNQNPLLIEDYAHHPTEIKAVVDSVKAQYFSQKNNHTLKNKSSKKLCVIFQPHTYSRTKLLYNEFLNCFKGAKETLVYKVYSARESECEGINEKELARGLSLKGEKAFSFDNYKEMKNYILSKVKESGVATLFLSFTDAGHGP